MGVGSSSTIRSTCIKMRTSQVREVKIKVREGAMNPLSKRKASTLSYLAFWCYLAIVAGTAVCLDKFFNFAFFHARSEPFFHLSSPHSSFSWEYINFWVSRFFFGQEVLPIPSDEKKEVSSWAQTILSSPGALPVMRSTFRQGCSHLLRITSSCKRLSYDVPPSCLLDNVNEVPVQLECFCRST